MDQAGVTSTMRKKGQKMVLTRKTISAFDGATGATTETTLTWDVYGITKNYTLFNNAGSLVLAGDKKALIEAGVVVPAPGDLLLIMGVSWTVISVDPLSPQGVNLMFTCQVRR